MTQYLEEFELKIEGMKSLTCNQPFVFGPSKRYVSKILVELSILVTRLDGKEDVLTVKIYLVDVEVPFLCGKQTLESWNFKIDGNEIILEIKMKTRQDNDKKLIRMIDTAGGHYGIILEMRTKSRTSLFLVEDDSGILFVQDENGDLCSFKSVRKVHKGNTTRVRTVNGCIQEYWMDESRTLKCN